MKNYSIYRTISIVLVIGLSRYFLKNSNEELKKENAEKNKNNNYKFIYTKSGDSVDKSEANAIYNKYMLNQKSIYEKLDSASKRDIEIIGIINHDLIANKKLYLDSIAKNIYTNSKSIKDIGIIIIARGIVLDTFYKKVLLPDDFKLLREKIIVLKGS